MLIDKNSKKPQKPVFKKTFVVQNSSDEEEIKKVTDEAVKANSVYELKIADIVEPKFHDRTSFNQKDVDDLAANIKRIGLIHPIAVRKLPDGRFERISGFMRINAYKQLERETIPAVILVVQNSAEASFAMLSENIHRRNLDAYDEVKAFIGYAADCLGVDYDEMLSLINRFANADTGRVKELTEQEQEQRRLFEEKLTELGKYTFSSFRRKMSVLNMHKAIIDALKSKEISYSYAQILHALRKDEKTMMLMLERAKQGEFQSKEDLNAAVKQISSANNASTYTLDSKAVKMKVTKKGVYSFDVKHDSLTSNQQKLFRAFLDSVNPTPAKHHVL